MNVQGIVRAHRTARDEIRKALRKPVSGIGMIWFRVRSGGEEESVAYSSVDITSLGFGEDASYQNTSEFMASLLCARGLSMLGAEGAPVMLRGYSVSALTWAGKGSVRSDLALRASAMWAQYAVVKQINVVDTVHVSHERNSRTDILSRGGSWSDVLVDDRCNYGGQLQRVTPELNLRCEPLLHLVNPRRTLDSDSEFNEFFGKSLRFFESEAPPPPARHSA